MPRDLETICLKCLQKEPPAATPAPPALADDLHRFLAASRSRCGPVGRLARRLRRVRRRPVQSTLVAAVTLLTAALLGGDLWLISDWAAAARKIEMEQAATERAATRGIEAMPIRGMIPESAEIRRSTGLVGPKVQRRHGFSSVSGEVALSFRTTRRVAT